MASLYAALFGLSVLILFGIVYWRTASYMERQMREVIDADIQSLVSGRGADALRGEIQRRLARSDGASTKAYFLLQGAGGAPLAGNLPAGSARVGWDEFEVAAREGEEDLLIVGRGVRVADGSLLFVGRDARQLDETRELPLEALAWALAATLLLAVIGGAVMSAGLRRRVEAINRIAAEIVRGDLGRRIPDRDTDDEFDVLARQLNHMLDRIQALMEGMRQVTNDVAHDLRTPLGRLRQRLERARREARTVADYERAVDGGLDEIDRILDTFGALLRIAQIESGSRRAHFTRIDLSGVLDTVLDAYTPVAEESGHALHGAIARDVCVRGDRDLLVQLFANLIENALRHTPVGSRIDVTLEPARSGPIAVVADNGPGIPAEARPKVLQRFYRLESSRSTPGSGLGLSLVAAVAELHDAALDLGDNRPGLRVTLRFPRDTGP